MNKWIITNLILLSLVIGCDSDHPLKPGYVGKSFDKPQIHEAVKKELSKSSIDFYTYIDEGIEVIAFRKEDKDIVGSILNKVTGGPPEGYTGLCYGTLGWAEKQQQLLSKNRINSLIRKRYSKYCVYWNKKDSDGVEKIDKNFKEIRAHQKNKGNEI